ncbi:MAG: RluA family pseudouridine synthase [Alphaproteobacteria bacterium]|nr:RluA family pseudouridine synthase [Alphaproteobacteria bacterium]
MEIITIIVEKEDEKQRLDKFLAQALSPLTRTRIKALMDDNKLECCGEIITSASRKVQEGEVYTLKIPPAIDDYPHAEDIPLSIIYEDDDLLVLDKPAGMVVHPAPGHRESTLVNALLAHCKESLSGIGGVRRPGIVHRLDKETSGLMVVAKNDIAHQGLSAQFTNRTLSRSYLAIVWGIPQPKEAIIEGDIGRSPKNRQKMAVVPSGGKPAITHYCVIKRFFAKDDVSQSISMVRCELETGRTHQIRVHMAHIGHPLVGDPVYGRVPKWAKKAFAPEVVAFPRQALHAFQLKFLHPRSGELMIFEAPLPADLETLISFL